MARNNLSLFLFAAVSIALFGFIEGCYHPRNEHPRLHQWIDIDSPYQYEKLLAHYYRDYLVINVRDGAHPNVLGEAKRWSQAGLHQIRFTDENGNRISLDPRNRRLTAQFKRGDLFAELPTDYRSYTVTVKSIADVTEADWKAIDRWQSASYVSVVDENGTPIKLSKN